MYEDRVQIVTKYQTQIFESVMRTRADREKEKERVKFMLQNFQMNCRSKN